jgi:quaternary ammonium compound-resistance protein SugE
MAWVMLVVAGLFEVGWAIGLKYTHGFTRPLPSVLTIIAIVISMTMLAFAVRTIPVGTGYAIWTGIGAVGTATLGIWLFQEPVTPARIAFLLMIVAGIIGLKFSAGASPAD